MALQVIQPGQTRERHTRTPNFPVAGIMKPYGLYPIMCHPVLPGETLTNFRMKWRVLSKPIVHPLCGAWLETWLVYVKLTDLDRDLGNMFIDDTYSTTGYVRASDRERYFTKTGQYDWVKLCTERFHDAYHLHGGATRTIDGMRKLKTSFMSWYQNMIFRPADDPLDVTDVLDAKLEMDAFMMMQQMSMSELTYEHYLEQYGVRTVRASEGNPEIFRYSRSWTQPVNTVDSSTGTPSSAWVWNDEMKAAKDKRFQEPGFLLMFAAVRPKMFNKHTQFAAVNNLWGFSDWYPAYNLTDPTAGIKEMVTDDLVFHADHRTDGGTKNMLYDHRDLLNHGEQFINEWGGTPYALPLSTGMTAEDADDPSSLQGDYVEDADVDALFVSATSSDKFCFYEGMASATILGHVTDTTRGN